MAGVVCMCVYARACACCRRDLTMTGHLNHLSICSHLPRATFFCNKDREEKVKVCSKIMF